MKVLSKTRNLVGKLLAGMSLTVTMEEPAGRVTSKKTVLHQTTLPRDVEYDTVFVARLDVDECVELGLKRGIGAFVGKTSVA